MPSKSKAKSTGAKSQSNGIQQPSYNASSKINEQTKKATTPAKVDPIHSASQQEQASTASQTQSSPPLMSQTEMQDADLTAPGVNRKKQKRRLKEAAKKAGTISTEMDGIDEGMASHTNGFKHNVYGGADQYGSYEGDDAYYTDDADRRHLGLRNHAYANHNHIVQEPSSAAKRTNKDRAVPSQAPSYAAGGLIASSSQTHLNRPPPPPPPPLLESHSTSITRSNKSDDRDRIWNTSTAEERERIKEFWLGLGESERRGLVRIEKEAVLKKMKEQQKHSCSCTVCGRKRVAIEEELEVLYDAYYEELETYANHQHFGLDASALPPPRSYGRPRSVLPPGQHMNMGRGEYSSGGRVEELDEDDEEVYSDEDEDEDISGDEMDPARGSSGGIFNFGNSLTAQGGILTVADDLLKNDGKKFIEMMEQLAERRMQREEESRMLASGLGHPSMRHPPPEEEDDGYDDEDDEEDYNSEEEDEFEDDEMEALSEEQRMEEGRRMFQIFAARMFEQRVLNAYRQKVAEERQRKLIEELAEDEQLDAQREAKRAKEAQKKKDKRQKQKQVKDEERAKKEAEKVAEEAATKAIVERKAEEQRQRKEEQRKRKEAERRAAEEERKRKEEEKQRQIRDRKEQQAEMERKQREQKEREKRKREEAKAKEREARENKEKERKEREAALLKAREPHGKPQSAAKERIKLDELPAKPAAPIPKRPSPANVAAIPAQASLQPSYAPSAHASPRLPIATPVLPKPPTPGRARQLSNQDSRNTSPKPSQPASSSTASPAAPSEPNNVVMNAHSRKTSHSGPKQPSAQPSRFSPLNAPPGLGAHPAGFSAPMPLMSNGYPSTFASPVSPMSQNAPVNLPPGFQSQTAIGGSHYRNPSIPHPPGINPTRHPSNVQQGNMRLQSSQAPEGGQLSTQASNPGRFSNKSESTAPNTHSRNQSTSSNVSPRDPNQRPAPIQRPSSVVPHQQKENDRPSSGDFDDLSGHLGSSALLEDTDDAPSSAIEDLRRGSVAVGGPRRQGFGAAPGFAPIGVNTRTESGQQSANNMWSNPQASFSGSGRAAQPFSPTPGFGRPANGGPFGSAQNSSRPIGSRHTRIRLLVCNACAKLTHWHPTTQGWHHADHVVQETQRTMYADEPQVDIMELLRACDEKGNAQNGGGQFDFRGSQNIGFFIKHISDTPSSSSSKAGPGSGDTGNEGGAHMLPPIGQQSSFPQSGSFQVTSGF